MFAKKLLLAVILAPPFIWVWYTGGYWLSGLMVLFSFVAADEIAQMASRHETAAWSRFRTRIAAGLSGVLLYVSRTYGLLPFEHALLMVLLLAFVAHLFAPGDMNTVATRTFATVFGAVYAAVPISYLITLRELPDVGRTLSFLALSLSWFSDTFAYFGGRAFGKHKLYPLMSPNKTVEGLVSGAVAAGIAAVIVTRVGGVDWPVMWVILLGAFAAVWGQIGDLSESMIKRSVGVKDAGAFLGSHGGVLDRFDAVLFVTPLVYLVHVLMARS